MKLPTLKLAALKVTASAIAERGLLGLATLAVTVLLGRWAGQEELGVFALFFPIVFIAIVLEESLITAPYTVFAAGEPSSHRRRKYLGAVLAHTLLLSGGAAAMLLAASGATAVLGYSRATAVIAVLAPVVPAVLLREFARRVVYADLHPQSAVILSGGTSALQIGLMALLHVAGRLTAATAFMAMGASSAVGAAAWIVHNRHAYRIRARGLADAFWKNWRLGKWIVCSQTAELLRIQLAPWLLAWLVDVKSVGLYAACAAVATLSTALLIALSNVLVPQLAAVARQHGPAAMHSATMQATRWLTAAMALITAVLIGLSGRLIPWIYGPEYINAGPVLTILAVAQFITGATLPVARALVAFRRTDLDFGCHLAGVASFVGLGTLLVARWGVVGAAYALLVSTAVKAFCNVLCYRREFRQRLRTTPAAVEETKISVDGKTLIGAKGGPFRLPRNAALAMAAVSSAKRQAEEQS